VFVVEALGHDVHVTEPMVSVYESALQIVHGPPASPE
jgi:hypothetical protein